MGKKTILVTGGAGFVGSNLIKRLVAEGNRVISLDNYFVGSKEAHVEGAEYRGGHTKDIERLILETPDLIYHLGEYSRVEQSVLEPDIVHDLNTVGTAAVVEFWRKKKCKLVYAGSSTKFGDGGATRTTSPYAATKAANTETVKEIGEREHLPFAITYFYNVFGPGERTGVYGTVIESFKQMCLRGTPLTVVMPGTQMRNFTHVDDIVDGLILVGESGEGDEYGLGREKAYAIIDIARLFGTRGEPHAIWARYDEIPRARLENEAVSRGIHQGISAHARTRGKAREARARILDHISSCRRSRRGGTIGSYCGDARGAVRHRHGRFFS